MYELRLCVTKDCNFKCSYCRPGGEGNYNQNPIMTAEEIKKCVSFLSKEGFDSVRITGGEPLLRKDLVEIINIISNIEGINEVSLITNGSLLNADIIQKLKESKLASVTVSLDTFDPVIFKNMVRVDCFDKVIENIILLSKSGIKTRINAVMTSENKNTFLELRKFCDEYGIDIKLLDLNNTDLKEWEKNYVDLDEIISDLRKSCLKEEVQAVRGNAGTPMNIFNFGNHNVIIKDSKTGTCYVEDCKKCKLYPCQEGVSSPTVTHDGYIKFCNLGEVSDFSVLKLAEYSEKFNIFNSKYQGMVFKNEWYNHCKGETNVK